MSLCVCAWMCAHWDAVRRLIHFKGAAHPVPTLGKDTAHRVYTHRASATDKIYWPIRIIVKMATYRRGRTLPITISWDASAKTTWYHVGNEQYSGDFWAFIIFYTNKKKIKTFIFVLWPKNCFLGPWDFLAALPQVTTGVPSYCRSGIKFLQSIHAAHRVAHRACTPHVMPLWLSQ